MNNNYYYHPFTEGVIYTFAFYGFIKLVDDICMYFFNQKKEYSKQFLEEEQSSEDSEDSQIISLDSEDSEEEYNKINHYSLRKRRRNC